MRTDIQALRGLAILLVLLHHAKLLPWLKAGYLGVDVFFVVSGYLITGIVQRALQAGTFSFTAFYVRRAKRLLPAAYVTFLLTVLASSLFLTRSEMRDFIWQLLGAVTFTGNIALWMQTGYFEGAAYLKPLLHVWSLSIEEQYYLLMPAALVFTPRRFWRAGVLLALAGSLALCLMLVSIKPGATFYLLPTRAWEMALGSLGVLVLEGSAVGALLTRLFWPALVTLLTVPFFPTGAPHPGLDALIVCVATLIIILRQHPVWERTRLVRPLAWLGDVSYSLYLVHWPLIAFAASAWVSPVPSIVRSGLALLALGVAWVMRCWVEQPGRQAKVPVSRASFAMAIASSGALIVAGLFPAIFLERYTFSPTPNLHQQDMGPNHGLNAACNYGRTFVLKSECTNSVAPQILVWGDSFAAHLVPGIAASTIIGLVQATKAGCKPFLSIAEFDRHTAAQRDSLGGCESFNESVLEYLRTASSVDVVILSSSLYHAQLDKRLVPLGDKDKCVKGECVAATEQTDEGIVSESIQNTSRLLRAMGKRVVLVSPPPMSGFDVGRCLELTASRIAVYGADSQNCQISEERYRRLHSSVVSLLEHVVRDAQVPVFNLDQYLCVSGWCAVESDGVFLYRNAGHLSHDGSRLLGQKLDLANRLMAIAR